MLYGRDAERAWIGELLDAARDSRSGALVVRGEPGIGKTALLDDTRERAEDMHVLSARGVESEAELPFAALHQLFRPALPYLEGLPAPQSAALSGALGLDDGRANERFLVFTACLSLLSELAERRPVLCLVDDAHWLDDASADALRFVARRLDAEGIVILFGAREADVRAFEAVDVPELRLAGLDGDAAATLLARGGGLDAAPAVRDRLVERTRGNALALLELPGELTAAQLAGEEPLPEALPMTRQVEAVFLERVRRLPESTQRFLLIAAADESEDAALVARASEGLGIDGSALDEAERAGLVTVHGTRLEFRHPLVRSAVYDAATSSDRRSAHRTLAEALGTGAEQADRRAWHLAASAIDADETVIAALDDAATRAQRRAAYGVAAKALERAAELSIDDSGRGGRLVEAARCASLAGADERAASLARRAVPLTDDARGHAELAQVLAIAEIRRGRPPQALPMLLDAAREIAASDPAKALELLLDASWAAVEAGDSASQLEAFRLGAGIEPRDGDGASRFAVDLLSGLGAIADRDPAAAAPRIERLLAWGALAEEPRHVVWAGSAAFWLGDAERAQTLLERGARLAREQGALGILVTALDVLGLRHYFAQRFDQAVVACREAVELNRELGSENLAQLPLFVLAAIAAIRGDDEEADRRATASLEYATAHGQLLAAARATWALALLDLGRGSWEQALERLQPLGEVRLGFGDLLVIQTLPDRIEAAVRAGRPEVGRAALVVYAAWAERVTAPWARPRLDSCRALVAEGDEATEHFEAAIERSGDARPFDLARIQLLYGEHLRRERRRADSRPHLRAAVEGFERLRAEPWAERARAELRASGETARKRDPSTAADLTPQELQIARFVAEGMSNKEVAAQLFLSPRTIDAHLRNVYGKLGIRSRTQLARMPLAQDGAGVPAPS